MLQQASAFYGSMGFIPTKISAGTIAVGGGGPNVWKPPGRGPLVAETGLNAVKSAETNSSSGRLARLLGGRRLGIVLSDHTDQDGGTIFQQACKMGLEGIVSKRLSAPYRSGPSGDWIKVKNPDSPAMIRARKPSGEECGRL